MSELISLSATEAAERVRAGEIAPAELFTAYRDRAAGDGLNAFTWVAEKPPATASDAATAPLGGVPVAAKDLFCTEGAPSQAGSRPGRSEPTRAGRSGNRRRCAGSSG